MSNVVIVTATTNKARAKRCIDSWMHYAGPEVPQILIVENGGSDPYLGTVPAFRQGVDLALTDPHTEIIACLHDDFEIKEHDWVTKVVRHFQRHPKCGLLGFGGAIGLGDTDIYQKPYQPIQLARIGFRSNLDDAEAHGMRSLLPEPVACLDGFSQIGRRAFWQGCPYEGRTVTHYISPLRPWTTLESLGIVHHFYDGALGCLARRQGWETWYLPLRAKHHGGQTAVGDNGYQEWAKTQIEGGDYGFWKKAHDVSYEAFRDVLPLRA